MSMCSICSGSLYTTQACAASINGSTTPIIASLQSIMSRRLICITNRSSTTIQPTTNPAPIAYICASIVDPVSLFLLLSCCFNRFPDFPSLFPLYSTFCVFQPLTSSRSYHHHHHDPQSPEAPPPVPHRYVACCLSPACLACIRLCQSGKRLT